MKKANGMLNVIFWLSVPLVVAHVFICWTAGPSEVGGSAFGRAVVCAAVGMIAYVLTKETES